MLKKSQMPAMGLHGESITYADLRKDQPVFLADVSGHLRAPSTSSSDVSGHPRAPSTASSARTTSPSSTPTGVRGAIGVHADEVATETPVAKKEIAGARTSASSSPATFDGGTLGTKHPVERSADEETKNRLDKQNSEATKVDTKKILNDMNAVKNFENDNVLQFQDGSFTIQNDDDFKSGP